LKSVYWQLIRFLMPLVITMIVQELGGQVLNGGMARVPQATATLASYGLAWGLVNFFASPLMQVKQLGLVLVDSRQALGQTRRFVWIAGLLMAGILALLALTPLGVWVVEDLHGVSHSLGLVAREAIFWLIPVPLLRALGLYYAGLLIRIKRTDVVSYAVMAGIGANIVAVFGLLPAPWIQDKPIWLPILVTYAGIIVELAVTLAGYRRHVELPPAGPGQPLRPAYVLRFFWPLALIMGIQGFSRPLINLFVSRGPGGEEALAILTILYTLGHLPYGWLNEIRNLAPAFREQAGSLAYIRRFAIACGLASFGLMVLLFWTPVRDFILGTLIGLAPALVVQAGPALAIFSFFPLVVMIRAYYHGLGLLQHRTQALAPSAPARIAAILITLTVLPLLGIHGATRGVAALFSGFACEAAVVWWGIQGRARLPGAPRLPGWLKHRAVGSQKD
jgi:hypothetical protein